MMRFLLMHRLDESAPEAWNPSPEFIEKIGAMMQDWTDKGVLITAEGVHPSARGALVRKARGGGIPSKDGPFTQAKQVVGGLCLVNAPNREQAVEYARQ